MTFTATDPNGTSHKRNSKREFTHVVFAIRLGEFNTGNDYIDIGWCGSLRLAEKLASKTSGEKFRSGKPIYTDVCLVSARVAA